MPVLPQESNTISSESPLITHLVVHQYMHDVVVDFRGDPPTWLVGKQDILYPQKRDQDEGGPHCLHVETGLCLVGYLQLGDENPHNVKQEKDVDLVRVNTVISFKFPLFVVKKTMFTDTWW